VVGLLERMRGAEVAQGAHFLEQRLVAPADIVVAVHQALQVAAEFLDLRFAAFDAVEQGIDLVVVGADRVDVVADGLRGVGHGVHQYVGPLGVEFQRFFQALQAAADGGLQGDGVPDDFLDVGRRQVAERRLEFVDGYGAHGFVELPALGFPGLEALVDQEGDGRGQNRQAGGDVDTELNFRQIHLQEFPFLFHNVNNINISRFYFAQ